MTHEYKEYELFVEADTNDADYITTHEIVTQKELDILLPAFEVIKKWTQDQIAAGNHNNFYNWNTSEYNDDHARPNELYKDLLTEDQLGWLHDYVPHGEHGVHTINSVKYYPIKHRTEVM